MLYMAMSIRRPSCFSHCWSFFVLTQCWYTSLLALLMEIWTSSHPGIYSLITSDKGGGTCFCPCLSVCLSVSKITQKCVHGCGWNVACRQMLGHRWTDYLLSPIQIIVWIPEPDCFFQYCIGYGTLQPCLGCQRAALLYGILCRENPMYMYWRRDARASRGFKMVLFTEPSEDLCRK